MRISKRRAMPARPGGSPRHRAGTETGWTRLSTALGLAALMVVATLPTTAAGQEPDPTQVQNLTVTQRGGYATLAWTPVPGAGQYVIERTPVDAADNPTGSPVTVGIWRPNRQVNQAFPTFADAGFNPGDRFRWQVRAQIGAGLPNQVIIDAPSTAAGTYGASQATYGPAVDAAGFAGPIVLVNSSTGSPTEGCGPLTDFPSGAIALIDRGTCNFTVKTVNAQAAGASAVILANNTGGTPTNPTGTDASITISTVMVSQADGATLKGGLPATGRVAAAPVPPLSDPVFGTTTPTPGPEEFRTQFELTQGAQFTSYDSEIEWTERIAAESPRVRIVEIGRTPQNRAINLFVIGHPAPLGTVAEIAASPTAGANCNVHGNEPSGREGCFMMIRELAFSQDPAIIDILSNATVLIVPSINGDGRAANVRGNSTGQDLNRDHGRLTQPETQAFAAFVRDYSPEVMVDGHEYGNNNTCDLPLLWSRHSNTAPTVHNEGKEGLVEGWFYTNGAIDGWWGCPYPEAGIPGAQTFTRVNGLKNMIVTLVEARSAGGATRPNEGNTQVNRRRKAYSQVWSIRTALDYHRASQPAVAAAIAGGIAYQSANTGPAVLHGDWDVAAFPAPHPGDSPPPNNAPPPSQIITPTPCAYFLTPSQYTTVLNDSGNLAVGLRTNPQQRLAAHGLEVRNRPAGYLVPMTQPLRGLINIVLDPVQPSGPIIGAQRVSECPEAQASSSVDAAAVEDTTTSGSLTVSNVTTEAGHTLNWSITEAASDCAAPSDLGWVSAVTTSGSTPPGGSTTVTVNFDATGLTAPDVHTGVLCISSNDAGAPVIAVPVSLQVQYAVSGLAHPPAMTTIPSGRQVPVRFGLDGNRGLGVLEGATPTMRPIDCATHEPLGAAVRTTGGPLSYNAADDTYTYRWLVPSALAGTCRAFTVAFDDGSTHTTLFRIGR